MELNYFHAHAGSIEKESGIELFDCRHMLRAPSARTHTPPLPP
jgi:hypothetical protein